MDEVFLAITKVGMVTFVVAGMLSMGLRLTVSSIVAPLRDIRLVVSLVVVNFVVVPALVVVATRVLPMEDASAAALILLGCCAGAPFLPTLAKLSNGSQPMAVGAMVLLMVFTVVYAPVVVPLVIEGASVSAWDIASSLIVLMLTPLAFGLLVRGRYRHVAESWEGHVGQASTVGLALGFAAALVVGWRDVLGSLGSWIFIGTLIVVVVGLAAGFAGGFGRSGEDKTLLALATAQRNVSAAIVIAVSLDSDVVVRTLVAALILPIALILLAAEIGKRRPEAGQAPATAQA